MRNTRTSRCTRRAFTLIEVVVALTLSTIVLLIGRAALEQTSLAHAATVSASTEADRSSNGVAVLRNALLRANVANFEASFLGYPDSARFSTQCDTPQGWQLACTALVTVRRDSGVTRVDVTLGDAEPLTIIRRRDQGRLRFVDGDVTAAPLTKWMNRAAPKGVLIAFAADTMSMLVGGAK